MSIRPRSVLALAGAAAVLTACQGLKEALTAHVDVVARAGSQELSVTRLADLLGKSQLNVPVTRENADLIAQFWTGYQQLAYAGSHGDSLADKKVIDQVTLPYVNAMRLQKFMSNVQKNFKRSEER